MQEVLIGSSLVFQFAMHDEAGVLTDDPQIALRQVHDGASTAVEYTADQFEHTGTGTYKIRVNFPVPGIDDFYLLSPVVGAPLAFQVMVQDSRAYHLPVGP